MTNAFTMIESFFPSVCARDWGHQKKECFPQLTNAYFHFILSALAWDHSAHEKDAPGNDLMLITS